MVTKRKQHSSKNPAKQGRGATAPQPNKIGASTPYHFRGKNLTPYGGLLPVATLLEKLGFQELLEQTLSVKRITRVMSLYQFVLALVLGLYVGFARLNQLRFIARDPILTGYKWDAAAAAIHAVALSGLAASQRGAADPVDAAPTARTSLGGGQRAVDHGDAGHRTTVHTLYGQGWAGARATTPRTRASAATSRY